MRFLAAAVFSLMLFVIPGELAVVAAAGILSNGTGIAYAIWNIVLNGTIYLGILIGLHFSRKIWTDFRLVRDFRHEFVREAFDVTACQWVNLVGLVAIAAGAVIVLIHGVLPVPFICLFAVLVVGLVNVAGRRELVAWDPEMPQPRFDPVLMPPSPDAQSKQVKLNWRMFPDGRESSAVDYEKVIVVSDREYKEFRGQNRFPTNPITEYTRYVREGVGWNVVDLAHYFRQETEARRFSPVQEVENVVAMVRSIRYERDEISRQKPDWANYPIETLYEECGDCEDHAILAASILYVLGHDVGLVHLEFADSGHLALGYVTENKNGTFSVSDGRKCYAYVETVATSEDERIGAICEKFMGELKKASVVPV